MIKKNFYNLHSDICKTIGNPVRQAIIDTLRSRELTVTELVNETGITQATISQHLAILRNRGIVNFRRGGNNIYYSISNPKIIQAYDLISEVLQKTFQDKHKMINDAIEENK
jgi:ArsR family transcriptional regulator